MLYDGALRFIEQGKQAMIAGDRWQQNDKLQRAQRIVTELTGALDFERGGEIAQNLLSLYSFVNNELIQANVADEIDGLDRAAKVLSDLRESWVALESQNRGQRSAA